MNNPNSELSPINESGNPMNSNMDEMALALAALPENIKAEFAVTKKGHGSVAWRGMSRLTGVNRGSWGKGGHRFTKSVDEFLALYGIDVAATNSILDENGRIKDVPASLVIKYYAYQGRTEAQKIDAALGAIGLRTLIQKTLGWEPELEYCVEQPTEWVKRFEQPFYDQLSRLTGLKAEGHKRPALWGKLTKELFYDWLPNGIYEKVKRYQTKGDKNAKLHQYLGEDGLKVFESYRFQLMTLMQSSANLDQLQELLSQKFLGVYQTSLTLPARQVNIFKAVSQLQIIHDSLELCNQQSDLDEAGIYRTMDGLQVAIDLLR